MKSFVGAALGAALVAGCVTLGLDALRSSRSEEIRGGGFASELAANDPEPVREAGKGLAEVDKAPPSIRGSVVSSLPLVQTELWNQHVLFQADLVGREKKNPAADIPPATIALSQEPVPMPKPRPAGEKVEVSNVAPAMSSPEPVLAAQSSPITSFFEKLFRLEARKAAQFPPEATGRTAVYDIETRAVYLPTGEILEAHSGLGENMDDVRYVQAKSRGPTPPNVYALSLREKPFHGVQALRLTPVGRSVMFGRDGILAHPYMMGPNGQSNGCVSIQDYPKFLEAYAKGKINRLVVVPRLTATPDVINASAGGTVRRASL